MTVAAVLGAITAVMLVTICQGYWPYGESLMPMQTAGQIVDDQAGRPDVALLVIRTTLQVPSVQANPTPSKSKMVSSQLCRGGGGALGQAWVFNIMVPWRSGKQHVLTH